ncbi:MAG TPA: response regulator transcription factor [Anaerolineae bacterium]|nr:response regulator transcription factor [Anaerolineae bacterium]
MENLSFLLVDDHIAYRRMLRQLIESHLGWSVVAEASNGKEVEHLIAQYAPTVVLMDVSLPALQGITAIRCIKHITPTTRIVAFSSYLDDEFRSASMQAGADAYLLKEDLVAKGLVQVLEEFFPSLAGHATLEM